MVRQNLHEPVLVREVVEALGLKKIAHLKHKKKFIDATLGPGGHSLEILRSGSSLLGIDADPEAISYARSIFESEKLNSFKLVRGNFKNIDTIASKSEFKEVDGIVFDLGVSRIQLTSGKRGFSFSNPKAPLDMRIDRKSQRVTAADLINALRHDQLIELFSKVLTTKDSEKLADEVIGKRQLSGVTKVGDFLEICHVLKAKKGMHQATLPFLALRIAVNSELETLEEALPKAFNLLKKGGRLAIISFHSGEDRVVKRFYDSKKKSRKGDVLTLKPTIPRESELEVNPGSRSAKMRVLEKI